MSHVTRFLVGLGLLAAASSALAQPLTLDT